MIQLVVFCVLFFAIVVSVSPAQVKHPVIDFAAEARRLVHQSNWASIGTISTNGSNKGYPFVAVVSMADSKVGGRSTGDIFFYMMGKDLTAKDVIEDNRVSFMFSDAQEGDCTKRGDDPWAHECHRVIISGKVKKLKPKSDEHVRGMKAFHSRHPLAANWKSPDLNFYLCKLEITNVMVFGGYGGYHHVSLKDYLQATSRTVRTTAVKRTAPVEATTAVETTTEVETTTATETSTAVETTRKTEPMETEPDSVLTDCAKYPFLTEYFLSK